MNIYEFIRKNGYKALQGKQIDVCGETQNADLVRWIYPTYEVINE